MISIAITRVENRIEIIIVIIGKGKFFLALVILELVPDLNYQYSSNHKKVTSSMFLNP